MVTNHAQGAEIDQLDDGGMSKFKFILKFTDNTIRTKTLFAFQQKLRIMSLLLSS